MDESSINIENLDYVEPIEKLLECPKCRSKAAASSFVKVFDCNNNLISEMCLKCYSSYIDQNDLDEVVNYKNIKKELKEKFERFMAMADKGLTTDRGRLHLRLRKASISLRDSLKKFRQVSLEYEKFLNEKTKETEDSIRDKFEKA